MTIKSLEGCKVVTAQEMAKLEKLARAEGASELKFMEQAADGIARVTQDFIEIHDLPQIVTLLVGKGNNGGDALAAGVLLIQRGFRVTALHIAPLDRCSLLCQAMAERFRSCGGKVHPVEDKIALSLEGVILDGLVGTGFRGKAEGLLAFAIEAANQSGRPILAIDIPSGLNGTTGEIETIAIQATETIFLGLPKTGFFLKEGWDHVGELHHVDFGLPEKEISSATPLAYLLNEEAIPSQFPPIKRTRHKYQAGYVLAIAGSGNMPGAALLATTAALHSGAGIVRLFHPYGIEAELHGAPYELIRQGWDRKDTSLICHEAKRAKAMLIGPGIGRTKEAKRSVEKLLKCIELPMVIDGDALFFLSEHPHWKIPKGSVLTPHTGEMRSLLKGNTPQLELCQQYAEEKGTTIVLKGAPTFIVHPGTVPLVITRGDPGMATAGSGDVLTGMIAAMIAQGLDARRAAAVAVYLHGLSGETAASHLTSYCMTATDLIDCLPDTFQNVLKS
jgi:hydroxyethylthiazole kinase-like uncharacterized protein yjeF